MNYRNSYFPMTNDFIFSEQNNVVALYLVNRHIEDMDDFNQAGKPFLFQLNGGSLNDTITNLPVYVGREQELEELIQGRHVKRETDLVLYPVPFSCPSERQADIFRYLVNKDMTPRQNPDIRLDLEEFKKTLNRYDNGMIRADALVRANTEKLPEISQLGNVESSKPNILDYLRRYIPFL